MRATGQATPAEFFERVIDRFGLDGRGRLLDLGCGTGQIILTLSGLVERAVGMDPDQDMLSEAKLAARHAGADSVTWLLAGSDDLGRLKSQPGEFRLVTMGRSFHWMDGEATLRSLADLLVADGGVVIAGDGCGLWNGTQPWEREITATIQRWLGERRRAGSGYSIQSDERWEEYIPRIAHPWFSRFEFHQLRFQREWNVERILGHLYSTSFCSIPLLGDNREAFERNLRGRLLETNPEDVFCEDVTLDAFFLWKS